MHKCFTSLLLPGGRFQKAAQAAEPWGCTDRPRAAPRLPVSLPRLMCVLGVEWPVHVLEQLEIAPRVMAPPPESRAGFPEQTVQSDLCFPFWP